MHCSTPDPAAGRIQMAGRTGWGCLVYITPETIYTTLMQLNKLTQTKTHRYTHTVVHTHTHTHTHTRPTLSQCFMGEDFSPPSALSNQPETGDEGRLPARAAQPSTSGPTALVNDACMSVTVSMYMYACTCVCMGAWVRACVRVWSRL